MIPGESFTGVVTYSNPKGFAFAKRDDGGPDVFLPIAEVESDVPSIPLGARVRFSMRLNPRSGRTQGCSTVVLRTERHRGVLKCWHPSELFAFVRDEFGAEYYAHGSAFTAGRIDAGEPVTFEIATHPKNGRQIAIFIERPAIPHGIAAVKFIQNRRTT